MELCESCAAKRKKDLLFKALSNLETELITLEDLCDIIEQTDGKAGASLYLYFRMAEHVSRARAYFQSTWDISFKEKHSLQITDD